MNISLALGTASKMFTRAKCAERYACRLPSHAIATQRESGGGTDWWFLRVLVSGFQA
jgi:hypothetical protein